MKCAAFLPQLNQASDATVIAPVVAGRTIPRFIHQIFFSDRPMTEELVANIERLKELNPGWDHRLYDKLAMRDFLIQAYGPDILRAFNQLNPAYGAALADLFRYLVLYRVGGVYLDIKSAAQRPFDDVLRSDDIFLLSQWRNCETDQFKGWGLHPDIAGLSGGEFQQWHIAAAPGHPFLRAVIANVLRNIRVYNPGLHGAGQLGVLRVTGPIAYTLAIVPLLATESYRRVDASTDLGLGYSIFEGERHASLFRDHYSILREPVVRLSHLKKFTAPVFQTLRAFRQKVRTLKALDR